MRVLHIFSLILALCFAAAAPARASDAEKKVELQLVRNSEGAFASVALQFDLPQQVEDAVYKGVTLYFVQEAEIISERWYWSDKTVKKTGRYMRLSYQPLTRRWRLHVSSSPLVEGSLALSLGQSFDSLEEALGVVKRARHWRIASADELAGSSDYLVKFSFRLDTTQLPRIFQFSPFGGSGMNLQLKSQLPMPEASSP